MPIQGDIIFVVKIKIPTIKTVGTALAVAMALVLLAWGSTARGGEIHEAAKAGDHEKVRTLLKASPDLVNAKDGEWQMTVLHWAAGCGRKPVVELLLANKAEVNAKGKDGETPLHLAANRGFMEVVEVLLANKANVNAKDDKYGQTPLHSAAQEGNKTVVELLLANKANVNAKDNKGQTALHLAAKEGDKTTQVGRKEVVDVLLANKADVNAKTDEGWTPLHWAVVVVGNSDIADLLRQHGGKE